MDEREQSLKGRRTTARVVKIGDTMRRLASANSPFVQRLLDHLESRRFAGAPRFRGSDSSGRDVLTFIPGDVPVELGDFTDTQLESAARLLREFHDATADYGISGVLAGDVNSAADLRDDQSTETPGVAADVVLGCAFSEPPV